MQIKHLVIIAALLTLTGCAATSDITGMLNIAAQLVGNQQQVNNDDYGYRPRYRHHRRHWDNRRYWQ